MAQRGRPPYPGPLTPAEERVLECVREGMPNAEIAVRLGISVNTVRYHVSNLLSKAQVESRDDLARWRPPRHDGDGRRRSRMLAPLLLAKPVLLAVVAAVTVGAVAAFVLIPVDEQPVEAVELPEPFTVPDPDELREQGYVDTGPFLRTEDGGDPVLGHSPRELFSALKVAPVVLVGEPGRVHVAGGFVSGNAQFAMTVRHEDGLYTAGIRILGPTRRGQLDPVDTGIIRVVPSERELLVAVTGTISGEPHRSTVTTDGHLWVDPEPLDPGLVIDEWTGAAMDVSGATPMGRLDTQVARIFTACDDHGCYVSYTGYGIPRDSLRAPADGRIMCDAPDLITFYRDGVNLSFATDPAIFEESRVRFCDPSFPVEAGDELGPPGRYVIHASPTALARIDEDMSVGISLDGHLYAGDFAPEVGCPCRHGN